MKWTHDFETGGASSDLAERLLCFVTGWFTEHLLGADQELGAFLRARAELPGPSPAPAR